MVYKSFYVCACVQYLSRVRLFVTPWTVAHLAPLSMGFSRQEHCSGLTFPSPVDIPDPGIEPGLLHCRQILYQLSYKGSYAMLSHFSPVRLCVTP